MRKEKDYSIGFSFMGSSMYCMGDPPEITKNRFEMSAILLVLIIFPDRPKLKKRITSHEIEVVELS